MNHGVSGEGLGDLGGRCEAEIIEHTPDVLSLLMGVNDTIQAMADAWLATSSTQLPR